MGKKVRIADLVSRLGLIAPKTKLKSDWDRLGAVRDFYEIDLQALCEKYSDHTHHELHASKHLPLDLDRLLNRYGPIIWSSDSNGRPWLSGPDTESLYPKDLFYNDPADRRLIEGALRDLVIRKTTRLRTEGSGRKARHSSIGSDSIYVSGQQTSSPVDQLPMNPRCFAWRGDEGDTTQDHQSALQLERLGVWLGNDNDWGLSVSVTGRSFQDLLDHAAKPEAERIPSDGDSLDLDLQSDHSKSSDIEKSVKCAGCVKSGKQVDEVLRLNRLKLDGRKTIWSYRCNLRGRKVFALVKCVHRKLDSTTPLWAFRRRDGTYTTQELLATFSKASQAGPSRNLPDALLSSVAAVTDASDVPGSQNGTKGQFTPINESLEASGSRMQIRTPASGKRPLAQESEPNARPRTTTGSDAEREDIAQRLNQTFAQDYVQSRVAPGLLATPAQSLTHSREKSQPSQLPRSSEPGHSTQARPADDRCAPPQHRYPGEPSSSSRPRLPRNERQPPQTDNLGEPSGPSKKRTVTPVQKVTQREPASPEAEWNSMYDGTPECERRAKQADHHGGSPSLSSKRPATSAPREALPSKKSRLEQLKDEVAKQLKRAKENEVRKAALQEKLEGLRRRRMAKEEEAEKLRIAKEEEAEMLEQRLSKDEDEMDELERQIAEEEQLMASFT